MLNLNKIDKIISENLTHPALCLVIEHVPLFKFKVDMISHVVDGQAIKIGN